MGLHVLFVNNNKIKARMNIRDKTSGHKLKTSAYPWNGFKTSTGLSKPQRFREKRQMLYSLFLSRLIQGGSDTKTYKVEEIYHVFFFLFTLLKINSLRLESWRTYTIRKKLHLMYSVKLAGLYKYIITYTGWFF